MHKLSGPAAILTGLLMIATAFLLVTTPATDNPVLDHVNYPGAYMATHYLLAFGAVSALAVLPTIQRRLKAGRHEALTWASTLAVIGFALTAINNFRQAALDDTLAKAYSVADAAVQKSMVINWVGLVELSPTGWIDYVGVGLWILTVSVVAWRKGAFNRLLNSVGLLAGSCYMLIVIANALGLEVLFRISVILGGVLAVPIWFIGMGLTLMRRGRAPVARVKAA